MDRTDVLAVVGSCSAERERYAKQLADETGRMLIPARRLTTAVDPAADAVALAPWSSSAAGTVVEFPDNVLVPDVIGAFADDELTRLISVVCIADAAHLLTDLQRDTYATHANPSGAPSAAARQTAHSLFSATHLEYASTIVLVNWEHVPTNDLSTILALVSHLSPLARLQLERDGLVETFHPLVEYTSSQERPGWIGLLNGDYSPYMTDPRVSAFRYENVRPLHPLRLQHLLNCHVAQGHFGLVVRSSGFCRFATRPNYTAQWEHVGRVISFIPLSADDSLGDDEELLAIGQDLAFIGLDLDHESLKLGLDAAALSDEELAAGPDVWVEYTDPFPTWGTRSRRAD